MKKYEVVNVSGKVLGTFDNAEEAHAFADSQVNFAYVEDSMRYELQTTPDGYMVYDTQTGQYVCDGGGNNLFNSYSYAEDLMNIHNNAEEE
jgi:hypothetical protein